jgi:hypothetical protein
MGNSKSPKRKKPAGQTPIRAALETLALPAVPDFNQAALQEAAGQLEEQLGSVTRASIALLTACHELKANDPLQRLAYSDLGRRAMEAIAQVESVLPAYAPMLKAIKGELDQWHAGERRSRSSRFEAAARSLHWTIVGSWPEPAIQGIVFVVVDEPKDRATMNGRSLAGVPTVENLVTAVVEELERLDKNRTGPEDFIAGVWKAYQACGDVGTTGVPVFDLIAKLTWLRQTKSFQRDPRQDLFREYPLAQFRADLTHYLASGAPPYTEGGKSHRLEIVGGSFAQDGLFMYFPQTSRLATCGRLIFHRAGPGEKS